MGRPSRQQKLGIQVTRRAAQAAGVGKTDLKAGLPRGLQGMLQGLAEEVIGDGRP